MNVRKVVGRVKGDPDALLAAVREEGEQRTVVLLRDLASYQVAIEAAGDLQAVIGEAESRCSDLQAALDLAQAELTAVEDEGIRIIGEAKKISRALADAAANEYERERGKPASGKVERARAQLRAARGELADLRRLAAALGTVTLPSIEPLRQVLAGVLGSSAVESISQEMSG